MPFSKTAWYFTILKQATSLGRLKSSATKLMREWFSLYLRWFALKLLLRSKRRSDFLARYPLGLREQQARLAWQWDDFLITLRRDQHPNCLVLAYSQTSSWIRSLERAFLGALKPLRAFPSFFRSDFSQCLLNARFLFEKRRTFVNNFFTTRKNMVPS